MPKLKYHKLITWTRYGHAADRVKVKVNGETV